MSNRRNFLKTSALGVAGISLLPAVNAFAGEGSAQNYAADRKLRFVLASDGHYGQQGTDSDKFYSDLVSWMKKEHQENPLDLIIINGDLVHDRPDLLPMIKKTYFDKMPAPVFALPGNHDHADAALWKSVFGYEDNYVIDKGDIGFVLANTADTKGKYICPDLAFLKKSLDAYKSKKIVFVVLHVPPHIWMPDEKDIFIDCPEVISLLHSYPNIKAVFHGHDHRLDGIRYTGKLPHLFDSHFGGNWGTDYKGYRIVEVEVDDKISTYQINASQNPMLNSAKL